MRFRSYPKIGSHTAASAGGPWVATEKIHGANFVVAIDVSGAVSFGKRKAWLERDTPFFGWQLIAADLEERVRGLARATGAPQVVCYGELFGGGYPHNDVAAIAGLSAVQTGVWYAPDLRWSLFDVLVASDDDNDGELLAFSDTEDLASVAGLMTPPVVGRGRYQELEPITVDDVTRVPALLGLPPIAGNRREGIVLKPDKRMPAGTRPIVKRKLADFDDARFDAAEAWTPGFLDADALAELGRRMVNPARLASARSKVGVNSVCVADEVVLDVALDLEQVFTAAWHALGDDGEAWVLAEVRAAINALLLR